MEWDSCCSKNWRTLLSALLLFGIWIAPAAAAECDVCITCHGDEAAAHGDVNHSGTPGSGPVILFPDNAHDSAGRVGEKPYFDVNVDCSLCHNNNLPSIHGNDCAACHPSPYDTLGIWGRGCQQGGCHPFFHGKSDTAHFSVEDDCGSCHVSPSWEVPQSNCLNCHDPHTPGDMTPPVTTSDAQPSYIGAALIDFSITDDGKVGIGRTFYRIDGGTLSAGSSVVVTEPGQHELEFWSTDQYGNTESAPNYANFNITQDTTPPSTTSNAQSHYYQGGYIRLTATDDGTYGVKTTYYQLDDGPIQSGTLVALPKISGIDIPYTLTFWSEDWSGNVESQRSVSFTVTYGTGTIRLVWWDCDVNQDHCPSGYDWASWKIRRDSWTGTIVSQGSHNTWGDETWTGVDNVSVAISDTPYFVEVAWEWFAKDGSGDTYDTTSQIPDVYITEDGQIVRVDYISETQEYIVP